MNEASANFCFGGYCGYDRSPWASDSGLLDVKPREPRGIRREELEAEEVKVDRVFALYELSVNEGTDDR